MADELKHGDLAIVQMAKPLDPPIPPKLARYAEYRCPEPDEFCDPECCRVWEYFGSDWTDRPSDVEIVQRVRVVDCE